MKEIISVMITYSDGSRENITHCRQYKPSAFSLFRFLRNKIIGLFKWDC